MFGFFKADKEDDGERVGWMNSRYALMVVVAGAFVAVVAVSFGMSMRRQSAARAAASWSNAACADILAHIAGANIQAPNEPDEIRAAAVKPLHDLWQAHCIK